MKKALKNVFLIISFVSPFIALYVLCGSLSGIDYYIEWMWEPSVSYSRKYFWSHFLPYFFYLILSINCIVFSVFYIFKFYQNGLINRMHNKIKSYKKARAEKRKAKKELKIIKLQEKLNKLESDE